LREACEYWKSVDKVQATITELQAKVEELEATVKYLGAYYDSMGRRHVQPSPGTGEEG